MKGENEYSAAIVSATEDKVTVIVREIYQHPSQDGQVSFPVRNVGGLQPHVSDRIVRRDFRDGEELVAGTGYTIIGGEEGTELLLEETIEAENDESEEENDE